MPRTRLLAVVGALALAATIAVTAAFAATNSSSPSAASTGGHSMHAGMAAATTTAKATNLRVALNRLLGEHMLLAAAASQAGYSGQKDFNALAKSLDANSVETANAIGSVYGRAARNKFLNGRALWRDHIRFFVNYTVALAKNDRAGQTAAVNNLKGYVEAFSSFLASATGLPKAALRASIASHVAHLKGQIDAYSQGNYARAAAQTRLGYKHMGMTGDVLAAAIVKKFPAKFR
jgi:hypothetical protein